MPTDLIEVDPNNPSPEVIKRAAEAIRRGQIIAIPTDALYTIVADPLNLSTVTRVFQSKGREQQRSLPLLVSGLPMAEELAAELTQRFYFLARHYWPGPLTLIAPASARVPLKVTGNTGRLAMRHSRAVIANKLIELLDRPLISTSANLSGQPTCHSGIDVFGQMDGRVDLVLDGGLCVGEGATTVDVTEPWWRVIKEGSISEKEIAETLKGH